MNGKEGIREDRAWRRVNMKEGIREEKGGSGRR